MEFVFSHPVFYVRYAGLESIPGVVTTYTTAPMKKLTVEQLTLE